MLDHLGLKVKSLEASKSFYTSALAPLGFSVQYEGGGGLGFGSKDAPGGLWLAQAAANGPVHIAFVAKNRAAVNAFYDAAIKAKGKDNGKPGLRPEYHSNYYGAFVIDPDGNNVEACCHGAE